MILQGGQESDDTMRCEPCGFGEAMGCVDVISIGELIQSSRKSHELSLLAKPRDDCRGYACLAKVPRARDPTPTRKGNGLIR